ncbi:MAG: hypothetical protein AAFX81_06525 [Pseudomonadota bacterium]
MIPKTLALVGATSCLVIAAPIGRALADDDTKEGTVAFFMETGCPEGWSVATSAEGRLLLGVTDSDKFTIGGQGGGDALTNEDDRLHTHQYATSVSLATHHIEGDHSCCNTDGASPGNKNVPETQPGVSNGGTSGLPFAQLTVCEKTSPPTDPTASDPYPLGALSFFNADSCPAGSGGDPEWQTAPLGSDDLGYFVVPFFDPPAATLGALVGTGMNPGENREHSHAFSSSIKVDSLELTGKWGCVSWLGLCTGMTTDGTKDFSGTTHAASSALPYLTLMLCQKAAFSPSSNPPQDVPESVVTFFTDQTCPTGWKMTEATTGRYLVGLPSGGIPGATFGGEPLQPTESAPTPVATHEHGISGSVVTGNTEVALASGAGADDVGKKGTYTYDGTTDPASAGLPYMGVIQCQPCTANDPDQSCQTQ